MAITTKRENPDKFLEEYTSDRIVDHLLLLEDHFLEYSRQPDSQCLACAFWHLQKLVAYTSLECVKFPGMDTPLCQRLAKWAKEAQGELDNLSKGKALQRAKEARQYRYEFVEAEDKPPAKPKPRHAVTAEDVAELFEEKAGRTGLQIGAPTWFRWHPDKIVTADDVKAFLFADTPLTISGTCSPADRTCAFKVKSTDTTEAAAQAVRGLGSAIKRVEDVMQQEQEELAAKRQARELKRGAVTAEDVVRLFEQRAQTAQMFAKTKDKRGRYYRGCHPACYGCVYQVKAAVGRQHGCRCSPWPECCPIPSYWRGDEAGVMRAPRGMTKAEWERILKYQLPFPEAEAPREVAVAPPCPPVCPTAPTPAPTPTGKRKYALFPFQEEGVAWLKGRSYALLADEMGLGKTPSAIYWGADFRPVLVVVPAALTLNWQREITQMWRPEDKVVLLDGKTDLPRHLPDWTIISYGMLAHYLPALKRAGFSAIIIDEAHLVKNLETKRTKNVLELVAPQEPKKTDKPILHRLAVTGTPIVNRPIELFALLVFLGVRPRGDFRPFLQHYTEHRVIKGRLAFTGAKHLDELHQSLKPFMLRRLKKDVLKDLPPKLNTPLFVPITNAAEYKEAERSFLKWLREKRGDAAAYSAAKAEIITKMNALRQLSATGKVQPVCDWLKPCRDGQGKVLIFCSFIEPLNGLAECKRGQIELYTGALSAEERQEIVDRFQTDPNLCFFAGTVGAAGVGITLTAANRVAFLDLPWTPGGKIQAEDRAHRIGQTQKVEIVNVLAKGTIDERMLEILREKEFIIAQAVDGKTRDEAQSGSIANALIESYIRVPMSELPPAYEPEMAEPDVDTITEDDLRSLQGFREPITPDDVTKLFQPKEAWLQWHAPEMWWKKQRNWLRVGQPWLQDIAEIDRVVAQTWFSFKAPLRDRLWKEERARLTKKQEPVTVADVAELFQAKALIEPEVIQDWQRTSAEYIEMRAEGRLVQYQLRWRHSFIKGVDPKIGQRFKARLKRVNSGQWRTQHRLAVAVALKRGDPVPPRVLQDYPDLVVMPSSQVYPVQVGRNALPFSREALTRIRDLTDTPAVRTHEHGFEFCQHIGPDGITIMPGLRCKGARCSIRVRDCAGKQVMGRIHTHPSAGRESWPLSHHILPSSGDIQNTPDGQTSCVGTYGSDTIQCWTRKMPKVPYYCPRKGAWAYLPSDMTPADREGYMRAGVVCHDVDKDFDFKTFSVREVLGEATKATEAAKEIVSVAPRQARLFDFKWLGDKLDPCNLTPEELDRALRWKPLRNIVTVAIGAGAHAQLCSVGMVAGIYELSLTGLSLALEEKVLNLVMKTTLIKQVHTPVKGQRVFEVRVPVEEEARDLQWGPRELVQPRGERGEQVAMFGKTRLRPVTLEDLEWLSEKAGVIGVLDYAHDDYREWYDLSARAQEARARGGDGLTPEEVERWQVLSGIVIGADGVLNHLKDADKEYDFYRAKSILDTLKAPVMFDPKPRWCSAVEEVEWELGKIAKRLEAAKLKATAVRERLGTQMQICRGQKEMW